VDSQSHRDAINTDLGGMGTTQGSVTGGSFAYTEPEMRAIITNWLDLADSYQRSLRNAEAMSRIEPPAPDFASQLHAAAANRSGQSYQRYLKHNTDYCLQQAELFQKTLDDYLGVEHTNATDMNNVDPQGPRPRI
jgi:hypothetical protein